VARDGLAGQKHPAPNGNGASGQPGGVRSVCVPA